MIAASGTYLECRDFCLELAATSVLSERLRASLLNHAALFEVEAQLVARARASLIESKSLLMEVDRVLNQRFGSPLDQ
jgi:hypothetical protein